MSIINYKKVKSNDTKLKKRETMEHEEYIENVLKTESSDFSKIRERLDEKKIRILHAILGISTEAGELEDQLKKHLYYGKDLDVINIEEEIGDLNWYMAILIDALGLNFEKILIKNIEKLKKRYGEKFSQEKAINRNLEDERKVLNG